MITTPVGRDGQTPLLWYVFAVAGGAVSVPRLLSFSTSDRKDTILVFTTTSQARGLVRIVNALERKI